MRAPVHLTFDDGPCPHGTPAVLDALAAHDARATFFVLGERVRRHPDLIARTLAAGHRVELHADRHVAHTDLDAGRIDADADAALTALGDLGVRPALWRTPWGLLTPASRAAAAARGLRLVHWDHDTHDWDGRPARAMFPALTAAVGRGARVVLAHDGCGPGARRTDVDATAALTRAVGAWARGAGHALDALPDGPPAADPRPIEAVA